jgi:hypothetical protein
MKNSYEYSIKVLLTPHPWDNENEPYFWVIFEGTCNTGCGWSKTPEEAWAAALTYYKKYIK